MITPPCLKLAIGLGVGCGVPLAEGAERIVRLAAAARFREDYALSVDFVNQLVARLQMQGGANRLWNGGLCLVVSLVVSLLVIMVALIRNM